MPQGRVVDWRSILCHRDTNMPWLHGVTLSIVRRYAAVNSVCRTYDSLILTVEEVAESSTYTQQLQARGLDHQLKSFSFIVALLLLNHY